LVSCPIKVETMSMLACFLISLVGHMGKWHFQPPLQLNGDHVTNSDHGPSRLEEG
jgi:hypothetical protein